MSRQQGRQQGHRIFAAIYDCQMRALEKRWLGEHRTALLHDLEGDVLEIGAGTGANLPHYHKASRVVAAEPDPAMRQRLASRVDQASVPVEIRKGGAEPLPDPDDTFDAVVYTLVLCTVPDLDRALAETARVLKSSGRLVVLEHVRGSGRLAIWQDRLDPLWSRLAAGCHPNRDIRAAVERAGFTSAHLGAFQPLPRWVLTSPMIEGVATGRASDVGTGEALDSPG